MINPVLMERLRKITPEEESILRGKGVDRSLYMDTNSRKEIDIIDYSHLLEKGKLIDIRPHTRFIRFPKHKHNFIEMVYMCEGETTHIVGEDKITLKAGELLFLSQNTVQEILPAGKGDIAVNFIILPGFLDKVLDILGDSNNLISEFLIGCLNNSGNAECLHFRVSNVLPVQNLIENLIWSLLNDHPNKRSINQVTMGLLFMTLLNCADRVDLGNNSTEQDIYIKVLDYIERNYPNGSLSALSEDIHYDIYNLSRIIKRISGQNFTDLLKKKRLTQAQWLLKNTKMPIERIALSVGYENKSYFYRIFHEFTGKTPLAYRKEGTV